MKRILLALACVTCLLAGCETAPAGGEPERLYSEGDAAAGGDGAAGPGDDDRRPEGGNVRSTPFHPPVPSEIERADLRYW
jgi:hypothetical protein